MPRLGRALGAAVGGAQGDDGSGYPLLRRREVRRIGNYTHAVIAGPMVADDDLFDAGLRDTCDALLAADGEVAGHYIEFDTGGGFVTAGQLVSGTIASLTKPVLAHCAYACSAGVMAASAATEVMATDDMATVGSIGVLASYPAWLLEYYTYVYTDIYARTSSDKNDAFRTLVTERDHGPTKDELDRLDAAFMALIRERRPGVTEEALRGGTYVGRDAIAAGLVDSIGNRADALTRLRQLAQLN